MTFLTTADVTIGTTTVVQANINSATNGYNSGTLTTSLQNEWTMAIASQSMTENADVTVTQNEWTLTITTQSISKSVGVTVTQGSSTGTLKTELTGDTTSIIITTATGVVFSATADVDIDSTIVVHANIQSATRALGTLKTELTGATTNVVIETTSGISFVPTADLVIGGAEWTLAMASAQQITENVGVTVTQNEWTLTIAAQDITESAGVTVTQGSVTGTLKTGLTGAGMTSVVISVAANVVFSDSTNIIIGNAEWTLAVTSQAITESAAVAVVQTVSGVTVTGTLKLPLSGTTTSIVIETIDG